VKKALRIIKEQSEKRRRCLKATLYASISLVLAVALCLGGLSTSAADGGAAVAAAPGRGAPARPGSKYLPGRVLVKYKPGVGAAGAGALGARVGASSSRELTASGIEQLDIGAGSVPDTVAALRRSPLVEFAEPDYVRSIDYTPNDPYYTDPGNLQWNMKNPVASGGIDMPDAWDLTAGTPSVVVAILDTGVAYRTGGGYTQAPDLAGTHFKQGYDFINNDPYADDDHGHGTHVSGTVAQSTNNALACAGVAFNVTVMPVKVLDRSGYGDDAQLIQGIEFAADQGASVINMSLGGPDPSAAIEDALAYAFGKNVVICAAAGNKGTSPVEYPAAYPECVAVGATNRASAKTSYSNYGSALDIVAPGGDGTGPIYQQTFKNVGQPASGFVVKGMTGTSMATPHVSAVAALVKARNPSWGASDVRGVVTSTAHDLGTAGWDQYMGWGLLDANSALQAAKPSSQGPLPTGVSPAFATAGTIPGVAIVGSGFTPQVKISLERPGEAGLAGSGIAVSGSTRISCNIPLTGTAAVPGLWNVVVESSTMRSGQIEGGFSVDEANNKAWYLAEGSTAHGFEEYILIQNPNAAAANVTLSLMATDGAQPSKNVSVAPNSRYTIRVNDVAPEKDVSARLTADQNIICERAMYWNGRIEGTDSIGIQSPSYSWYLAEGTTAYGFETYLLIQNPNATAAHVDVTYMTPQGPVPKGTLTVAGNSRYTITVANDIPSSDVSFQVIADQRVIAERSMYWDGRRGGHASIGTVLPAQQWYLAEGSTDWGFDEYVLIENPGAAAASVTMTYMTPAGPVPQPALTVAAGSRKTVHVNEALSQKDVSVEVSSDQGVVAERSMYWNNGTGKGGHDEIGVTQPRQQCFLAEGSTNWGFDEWVLIQNPNSRPANVGIDYMTSHGLVQKNAFTVAASSRVTVHVNTDVPLTDTSTKVYSNMPVIAERSMYWQSRGAGHVSIGLMK
jgi:serine protease